MTIGFCRFDKKWKLFFGGRGRSLDKMPANTRKIDDIDFLAIGLLTHLADPDAEFLRQLLGDHPGSKLLGTTHPHGQHEILREPDLIEFLQDEFAPVLVEAYKIPRIPGDQKS